MRKNAKPGVSAIRLQSRVSRDPEKGRQDEVGFLDSDKIHKMERDELEKFSASGSKTSGIQLINHEQVREGRGSKRCRKAARNIGEWLKCKEGNDERYRKRVGCL